MSEEKSNQSKVTRAWIEAAKIIAADPSAKVTCPKCGQGTLIIRDHPTHPDYHPDRVMQCDTCGARNVLHGARLTGG